MFKDNDLAILNEKAASGFPNRVGEIVMVIERLYGNQLYDYLVEFNDGSQSKVKETELYNITEKDKQYLDYIYTGNEVLHIHANVYVKIHKVDYLHRQAEVEFSDDNSNFVVMFDTLRKIDDDTLPVIEETGKFETIALEIGKFTDKKNKQYGSSVDATSKMIKVLMERYTYDNDNYLIPKDLIDHLLLTVRVMDKQNRIFNNPSGKGDSESPWNDITGYGLIGIDMVNNK